MQGLSEALLMLDTSRIIARGYAMVKEGDQVLDSVAKVTEGDPLSLIMRDGPVSYTHLFNFIQQNERVWIAADLFS